MPILPPSTPPPHSYYHTHLSLCAPPAAPSPPNPPGSGTAWLLPLVDGAPPIGWDMAARYLALPIALVIVQVGAAASLGGRGVWMSVIAGSGWCAGRPEAWVM